jgi:TonB-dependent receptor
MAKFMRRLSRSTGVIVAVMLVALPLCTAAQPAAGTLTGRVTDAVSGEVLPGAGVTLEGTVLSAAVARDGAFLLTGVPAGTHTVVVSYLGHVTERAAVTVQAGAIVTLNVVLRTETVYSEEVTVRAEMIQEGQARALNQQRTAPNIMNIVSADQIGQFPDLNAAEAAQRIPGVSIERDQGEGRYVLVRGTEARLNSMLINGERIPSPEGEIRAVALDVVPADLLQAIEVSKAVTPDMDADAIGGTVNLVTQQAPERARALFSVSGGFNELMSDAGQGAATGMVGRRFRDGRVGLVLAGSASSVNRGSDNFEVAYDDGDLEELEIRDYTVRRRRFGANGALDFRPSADTTYWVRGLVNRFSDLEYRRVTLNAVSDNELERELKDRLETQMIATGSFGGSRLTARGWEIDFSVSASYANEDEPEAYYTTFRQEDVEFSPNVSATSIDPDNIQANPRNEDLDAYALDGISVEDNFTSDRDLVGAVNLRVPLATREGFTGFVKTGAKLRGKAKTQSASTIESETEDDVAFRPLIDPDFDPGTFIGGRYVPGPHVSPAAGRALHDRSDLDTAFDFETDGADYDANEQVLGAYAMAELYFGPKLLVLPGVRVEATWLDYRGNEVLFDDDGDYESTRPVSGSDNYAQVLPGVHVRYAVTPDANVRAAITRTLARPNYYDLVPYQFVIEEDREVELGNPALEPTTSWNVDVMAERYFKAVGVVSGGLFYKHLSDYIYGFRFEGDRSGDRYEFTQPQNGGSARLVGLEFAFQSQLRFLPAPWDGLGLYANYTFTDSNTTYPGRDEDATLPGQSRHIGNLAVWYEKRGFSARASMNFHGKYASEVGGSVDEDIYYDNRRQFDVSISQTINRRVRIFADFLNLTNDPLRYYQGVTSRPVQEEYYSWWTSFGVKVGL